jgi:hypothetical protein
MMNINQKRFLRELAELLEKYSINKMSANYDTPIAFESNGSEFRISRYNDGKFERVVSFDEEYQPKMKEEQDEDDKLCSVQEEN